jgi:hypothetical protein
MHKLMLSITAAIPMLSGCVQWVVFGHTIGQDAPASTVAAVPAVPAAPAIPAACAAVVPQAPMPPAPASQLQAKTPVADVKLRAANLSFSPDAKEKIGTDPRFSGDALFAAINTGFRSHALIQASGDTRAGGTVEIVIDDFAIRPTSNAVILGYVLSTATLTGKVAVRDAGGRELRHFKIRANARLAAPANGEQPQSLDALYSRFTDLTVSRLTGVPIKVADQDVPR